MPDLDLINGDIAALSENRARESATRRELYAEAVADGEIAEPRGGEPIPGFGLPLGGCVVSAPAEVRGFLHVVPLWLFTDRLHVLTPCFDSADAARRFASALRLRAGTRHGRVEGDGIPAFVGALVGCPTAPVADVGNATVAAMLADWISGGPLDLSLLQAGSPAFEDVVRVKGGTWRRVLNRAGAEAVTRELLSDTLDRFHSEMSYHGGNETYSDWYVLERGAPSNRRMTVVVRVPPQGSLADPEVAQAMGGDPFIMHAPAIAALASHVGVEIGPMHVVPIAADLRALADVKARHSL
jgi:hypothetical protein